MLFRSVMAGHIAISGHLEITDDVRIGGNSCILRDVTKAGDYMGDPLVEKKKWFRMLGAHRELIEMQATVAALQKELAAFRNGK